MEKIESVVVTMTDKFNLSVETCDDGLITRVVSNKTEYILLNVSTPSNFFCFGVDPKKRVTPSKNWEEDPAKDKLFQRSVRIFSNQEANPCTKYPENNIRVMKLNPDGSGSLWTVAIVSQDKKFFLITQHNGDFQAYQAQDAEGKKVVCPKFEKWTSFVQYLASLLDPALLPPLQDYKPEVRKEPTRDQPDKTAEVVWFSEPENYGVIMTSKGPARVHWSTISRKSRRVFLKSGERVKYVQLVSPNETTTRGTAFSLEAVGVTVIE